MAGFLENPVILFTMFFFVGVNTNTLSEMTMMVTIRRCRRQRQQWWVGRQWKKWWWQRQGHEDNGGGNGDGRRHDDGDSGDKEEWGKAASDRSPKGRCKLLPHRRLMWFVLVGCQRSHQKITKAIWWFHPSARCHVFILSRLRYSHPHHAMVPPWRHHGGKDAWDFRSIANGYCGTFFSPFFIAKFTLFCQKGTSFNPFFCFSWSLLSHLVRNSFSFPVRFGTKTNFV